MQIMNVKALFLHIICIDLVFWTVCDPNGYYCTSSSKGNIYLKCLTIPCNGTLCETIIDYVDEDGPDVVVDPVNKILVNLEIENISIIHVLFINYVRDSSHSNNTTLRLMKPIVLKVNLDKPGELYKLRFINYVNGGPTEEVINKDTRENYYGCDSNKTNPTCGIMYYGISDSVPFSEGFCCSCIDSVNIARQPRLYGGLNKCTPNKSLVTKTEVSIQPRGEHDCKNISISPGYVNPNTYHESAHCFRYSDLWFNVFKVEKSQTFIPLTLKLFEKNENDDVLFRQQCFSTKSFNGERMISKGSVTYRYEIKGLNDTVVNDLKTKFVLIPQKVPETYQDGLPSLDGQPGKYLVIDPTWISINGTECDKIGVQPQAFYEQPERCYQPRGSCLNGQQPIDLLQKSRDGNRSENKRLFIEDYVQGSISFDDVTEEIIVNDYVKSEDDDVTVRGVAEIRLDENAVINNKILLQISGIHVLFDDDCNTATTVKVRVYVTNLGLKTAEFFIGLSIRNSKEYRQQAIVHPQQTIEIFIIHECHVNYCNGIARLYDNAIDGCPVASRKFNVIRGSRCYCLWHRRCECYRGNGLPPERSRHGHGSDTLDQAEYNKAGFLGDVPPETAAAAVAVRDHETVAASLGLLAAYMMVAVTMGLAKALSPYRSYWIWMVTSDWLLEMDAYKEPELRPCNLIRDDHGYYVHPVTMSRNIMLLSRHHEFIINALFFVNLPATLFRYLNARTDYLPICRSQSLTII